MKYGKESVKFILFVSILAMPGQNFAATTTSSAPYKSMTPKNLQVSITNKISNLTSFVNAITENLKQLKNEIQAYKTCQEQWKFYDPTNPEADKKGCINATLTERYIKAGSPKTCAVFGVGSCSVTLKLTNLFPQFTAEELRAFDKVSFTMDDERGIMPNVSTSPNTDGNDSASSGGKKGFYGEITYNASTMTVTYTRGAWGWGNHYRHAYVSGVKATLAETIVGKKQ